MQYSFHTIIIPDYPQPGEYLLYNTRSQALVKISRELKDLIDHFSHPDYFQSRFQFAEDILKLHSMGILVENEAQDLARLKAHMDQIKNGINDKFYMVTILTTFACNFKCVYCFEESSRVNEKMTPQTAEQSMDWIKSKIIKFGYRNLYLNFYGGEPLLNKPILEYIATSMKLWCEQKGIDFKFMMQTNGYLMTPELVDRYLDLGLKQARISVDGVGEDHDKHRPLRGGGSTFEVIMNNIMASCDKLPIGISVSFDKGDISHIERLFAYCAQKGIINKLGRFIFSPIHATLGPSGQTEKIKNAHCACNYEDNAMVENNRRIRELMKNYGLEMKNGMSTFICPVTRNESGLTIDQQGRIFKCNSMLGHPELSTGHVKDNDYNQQHQTFIHLDVYNQCPQDCTFMPMCSGGCRLSSFLKNQNFRTPACHKPYLNKMAPEIIKQEYQDRLNKKLSGVT
jgi:uncharacterized protein